jgi:peptidoglycan/LPS O-acetylase OafA/YrhL
MVYLTICFFFGLAGGVVGKLKGSSFFMWFVIAAVLPVLGLLGAVLYRFEDEELRRECPTCGHICMLYDAVCMRCGTDMEFPDVAIAPKSQAGAFPANTAKSH